MAGGMRRGAGFQRALFGQQLTDYLGGIYGYGAYGDAFQKLLGALSTEHLPGLDEMFSKYAHRAAGLGQAVPGETGWSGASFRGMGDIYSKFRSDVLGQALGVYTMPFQSQFGQPIQPYGQSGAGGGDAGGALGSMAGMVAGSFLGPIGTAAGGAIGGGIGKWLGGLF